MGTKLGKSHRNTISFILNHGKVHTRLTTYLCSVNGKNFWWDIKMYSIVEICGNTIFCFEDIFAYIYSLLAD